MIGTAPPTVPALLAAWEDGATQHGAQRALALLAVAERELAPDALARLSVGQRDARLLGLHAATFGSTVEAIADCPACRERLEVAFAVEDIEAAAAAEPGA